MFEHRPSRMRILRETEKAIENTWEKLFPKIEREMLAQVQRWEKRWHRHKFRMALMHGSLLVFVDPPIMRKDMPTHVGAWFSRGAIEDLQKEIEAFDDFLCDISSIMPSPADGLDTKHPCCS